MHGMTWTVLSSKSAQAYQFNDRCMGRAWTQASHTVVMESFAKPKVPNRHRDVAPVTWYKMESGTRIDLPWLPCARGQPQSQGRGTVDQLSSGVYFCFCSTKGQRRQHSTLLDRGTVITESIPNLPNMWLLWLQMMS